MKRLSTIFFCALAMFMTGCSKDVANERPSGDDAWRYDVTLPVPVQFGGFGATKAELEDVASVNGGLFGVFAFDAQASDLTEADMLDMRNAFALCRVLNGVGSLQLVESWYYPLSSDNEYVFYSYHTSQSLKDPSVVTEVTSTQALAEMSVGGTSDILWAKSVPEDARGFSGEYIRNGGACPSFNYTHPASSVTFEACIDEEMSDNYVRLDRIEMTIPTKAKLCVADIAEPENEGTFVWTAEPSVKFATKGGTGNLNKPLVKESAVVSDAVFIVPGASELEVNVVYSMCTKGADGVAGTGDDSVQMRDVVCPVTLTPGGDGNVFEAGMRYSFRFRIVAPKALGAGEDAMEVIVVNPYESAFSSGN